MGFIKSIKRFDTNFDVKLSTYAVPYMIGEIKRYIRDDGRIKVRRSIKELGMKIRELQREYLNKKGEEIKIEDIEKELKVSKEDIALAIEATRGVESIETAAYTNEKDGNKINLIEKISSDKNEEEIITNKLVIKELMNGLEKRDREVILLRFFKEKTQAQLAKREVSSSAVLQEEVSNNIEQKEESKEENKGDVYNYKNYGTIKLLHQKTQEVEEVALDNYLYNVVSAEMPADYEFEALKAQAIVARTYTVYKIQNKKHDNAELGYQKKID